MGSSAAAVRPACKTRRTGCSQPHLRVSPDGFANVVTYDGDAEVYEIERCGGVFDGIRDTKLGPARRYWIEL